MSRIKICLTGNGGSEWLMLPSSHSETLVVLEKIKAEDGNFSISRCESNFGMKLDSLVIGTDLNTANYLAARLSELSDKHIEVLDAMFDCLSDIVFSIESVIDFTHNLGTYEIYSGVMSAEDLARHYIYDSGVIQMPDEWAEGIDLEKFGKNLEKYETGHYTKHGYLISTGLDWSTAFAKGDEVPNEFKITSRQNS